MSLEVSTIKTRQAWVLKNPCRTIHECGKLGTRADIQVGGNTMATVLLIPTFKEPLSWDAQIGIINPDQTPRLINRWKQNDIVAALYQAAQLLQGVGSGNDSVDWDAYSLIVSRRLTVDEAAIVLNAGRIKPMPEAPALGEIAEYDFTNKKLEVDENLYLPENRIIIYEPGN